MTKIVSCGRWGQPAGLSGKLCLGAPGAQGVQLGTSRTRASRLHLAACPVKARSGDPAAPPVPATGTHTVMAERPPQVPRGLLQNLGFVVP